ncbi:hypothetical protein R5W24_000442 [Gemmata sp. JC717]|uniref:hypothetical protein n=1 Tax=Gemmata algarum TaxID=2975278 RepID=UPI0021BA790F|nr:hypothetical protein [Gemmata algarum]MDY3551366.1 hypothetical protein [Gemmata algarum]
MAKQVRKSAGLPPQLLWLADAPLFIDSEQVSRFHDAVVAPQAKEGATSVQQAKGKKQSTTGKATSQAKGTVGSAGFLSWFLRADAEVQAGGEIGGTLEWNQGDQVSTQWTPIDSAQRLLEQLITTYLSLVPERLLFCEPQNFNQLLTPAVARELPRALVLLDLPGQADAEKIGSLGTILIPTAVEFVTGQVVTLFDKLKFSAGNPPDYPDKQESAVALLAKRAEYWRWFQSNFSARVAMKLVEDEVSSAKSRIQWIDYRLPLTPEGHSLHLHLSPSGKYDTGTFAYNFIKRGYKHGLRIIGTLKSEPDINVLAVYEK